MNKEELVRHQGRIWIEKQVEAYRAKLEKEFDSYNEKDKRIRAWIKEHKDTESDLCEVLESILDRMMLTEDGDKRMQYWQSICAMCRGVEGFPIRRGS